MPTSFSQTMQWVKLAPGELPPEQVDILVFICVGDDKRFGHVVYGRNLFGRFAYYEPNDDRFYDYEDANDFSTPGFRHVTHYALVTKPED
jgi:hypothetical protein